MKFSNVCLTTLLFLLVIPQFFVDNYKTVAASTFCSGENGHVTIDGTPHPELLNCPGVESPSANSGTSTVTSSEDKGNCTTSCGPGENGGSVCKTTCGEAQNTTVHIGAPVVPTQIPTVIIIVVTATPLPSMKSSGYHTYKPTYSNPTQTPPHIPTVTPSPTPKKTLMHNTQSSKPTVLQSILQFIQNFFHFR